MPFYMSFIPISHAINILSRAEYALSNINDELKCPEGKMRENVEMLSQGDTETEYRAEIHGIILFCNFLNVCWC